MTCPRCLGRGRWTVWLRELMKRHYWCALCGGTGLAETGGEG
jgi:hypothetical protein